MRQVHPQPAIDTDAITLVTGDSRPIPVGRPWILVNMVTSLDGAVAVDGRSNGLGSAADRELFRALREMPDAIVVGAGTVRAENYGPVRIPAEGQKRRIARGQSALPRLVVITARLHLALDARLFEDPTQRPLIFTTANAPTEQREQLANVADIIECGAETVDLALAMARLREMGIELVLCEGGPMLNAQLIDADFVDEWCWTISPLLVGGDAMSASAGAMPGSTPSLSLQRIVEADGTLLLRYARES